MEAAEILQRLPQELFPGGADAVQKKFKEFAKIWHPDQCKLPEATKVFEHLKRSRDYLLSGASKSVDLHTAKGVTRYSYLSDHKLQGVRILVGVSTVSYLLNTPEMATWGKEILKRPWQFKDDKQRGEMMRFLPSHTRLTEAKEGLLVSYRRQGGDVLLADLVEYHQKRHERVPPLAVMWMVSGLLNLACYLEITKVAHCAITEQFVVVNPDQHEVRLEGPPLFAAPYGSRPRYALQAAITDWPILRTKSYRVKDSRLDLTMIRSMIMRLLGHRTARDLREDKDIPAGLVEWVLSPPPVSAVEDYVKWEDLRGKRAFHLYGLSARDIYVSLL